MRPPLSTSLPFKAFLAGLFALASITMPQLARAQESGAPQTGLPQITLTAGMHVIKADLADSADTRSKGLMFRRSLEQHQGMLFVFDRKEPHCFWMRNTPLPLTIAFVDDDGLIVNLADMKAQNETNHCAAQPVRYALEMNQGWFGKRNLKAGSRIAGLPKLKQ
jgi:uncharacterized protein